MWSWLRTTSPAPSREVILYTRQGCHLCEDALAILEQARKRFAFTIREVDIDADPELMAQFDQCVPVVAVDGRVHFRGRVNPVLLHRILRGGAASGEPDPA